MITGIRSPLPSLPAEPLRRALSAGRGIGWPAQLVALIGGVLLVVSAVIHLHLWMLSYQEIPTIGPLFLMQVVVGLLLGLTVAGVRRVWSSLLGAAFAVATLGGYVISVYVGLFGFQDSWSAPYAAVAFGVEIAAAAVLLAHSGWALINRAPPGRSRTAISEGLGIQGRGRNRSTGKDPTETVTRGDSR